MKRDEAQRKPLNERQSNNCSLPLSKLQQPFFYPSFFFPSKQLVRAPLCSAVESATEARPENTDRKSVFWQFSAVFSVISAGQIWWCDVKNSRCVYVVYLNVSHPVSWVRASSLATAAAAAPLAILLGLNTSLEAALRSLTPAADSAANTNRFSQLTPVRNETDGKTCRNVRP